MSEQPKLFVEDEKSQNTGPVTCLGIEFENDDSRREHYTEELRKKLLDPDFRKIEGFPIGEDEDILNLSDPPYYTVCPNPWIAGFVDEWEDQKLEKPEGYIYHREPFAADVKEGKNNPIYNAHTYHTKVPHKAIMRYILHYTDPGDIIFDGFAGTGMTGVAAQMCGNRNEVISLGYQVLPDGTILQEEKDKEGKKAWKPFSKLGSRKAILNDLSPAASFIAYNYNTPIDIDAFEKGANKILSEVEEECGWMYETLHANGKSKGKINYTVWSDMYICPECTGEIVFWESAVNIEDKKVKDDFVCPNCNILLNKSKLERLWVSIYDSDLGKTIKKAKQKPVLISYTSKELKGRFEKIPDEHDLELINKIEKSEIPYWFPTDRMMDGKETRRNDPVGLTHVHHFYTKRNLWVLSSLLNKSDSNFRLLFQSIVATLASRLARYNMGKRGNGPLSGTLYVSSLNAEAELIKIFRSKLRNFLKALMVKEKSVIFCQSFEDTNVVSNSIDYLFIDPPFGANLYYSELNYFWESWLKIITNNKQEAIENSVQGKGALEYRQLMTKCFCEAYRILKPGRWMTVEFSNTKASVWNSIQTALTDAGFIIANISALDKMQGSFKAVTTTTAVKQDLVISAYKPNGGFEERFRQISQTEDGVWDFVRTHLKYLPVVKKQGIDLVVIPERDPRILYDQVIAYYVRKGLSIPVDSKDFQLGLSQRFSERDGMYFLPEQVAEYDRKRMISGGRAIQQSLYVFDEASAIEWLRNLLRDKPQSFQDINPIFMKEISGWSKNEIGIELSILLEQNFLSYDGNGLVPEQIHSYLSSNWKEMRNLTKDDLILQGKAKNRWYVPDPNKAGDLEKLREKSLLKEFAEYKESKKKLKIFRLEAVRAGFKKAYQNREYEVIIAVAEKIPNKVLEEDPKLLMWFDQAVTRTGQG
jgi:DNA modification methylase